MNKWLAGVTIITFFILVLTTILFGNRIKKLEIAHPSFLTEKTTPSKPQNDPTALDKIQDTNPLLSVVAENLEIPWGLTFLPDKSILFTERAGRVRLIDANGTLKKEPIATISDVYHIGEGGLLGITIHPQFDVNKFVYLYYTYSGSGDDTLNRVVRYKLQDNSLTERKIIVDNIPGAANHNGGRIKFGPDGYLYITTGDSQEPSLAQNKSSLAGRILRVNLDGNPASDNPFDFAQDKPFGTLVYSYGHRNPQGLAWDGQGRLWSTEHGRSGVQSGFDELNLIEKGKNYGWPTIQGDEKSSGMVISVINSGAATTWAPAGMAYFGGSLYFGGLRGQGLYQAVVKKGDSVTLKKHFDGELGRIRDVAVGPDNMLYITTSNRDGRGYTKQNDDKIYKINPSKL